MINRIKAFFTFVISIFNPPLFYYRLHHYMNVPVTKEKAIKFRKKSRYGLKFENASILDFATYDGSGQAVHPNCLFFYGKLWCVLTPYPYGMEEYENPCIYFGDTLDNLSEYANNPISVRRKNAHGTHLSDPVLFSFNDRLYCCYRSTEKKETGLINNAILYKEIIIKDNEINLSKEGQIIASTDNQLLSPAFFTSENNIVLAFPDFFNSNDSLLGYCITDSLTVKDPFVMKCINVPDGYGIWHIDVKNDGNQIKGLFLLKDIKKGRDFKLFFSRMVEVNKGIWELEREIVIPKSIDRIKMHLYKSSFIPNSEDIILSIKDKKSRYHLIRLGGAKYD